MGLNTPAQWIQYGGIFQAGQAQYADLNGDGKADLIFLSTYIDTGAAYYNRFNVSLSTGTTVTQPVMWVQHGGNYYPGQAQYADVNGDGKADLIFQGSFIPPK